MSATPDLAGAEAAWLARVARHRLDAFGPHCLQVGLKPRAQRFLFLRHGETQGNHLKIFQPAEIELNDTGLAQAAEAAAALKGCGAKRILASTMRRAWNTAEIVGRALELKPIEEPGLRERWFGDLVGTTSEHMDWSHDPPNGEPLKEFCRRTCVAVSKALESTEPTLLIGHGGILYVLAYSLGVTLREEMTRNATPLLFERSDTAWKATPYGDAVMTRGGNIGW
jgi:broad specificity phosphatase PhoE